jgi:flagella basal body P-ring formation protein FlgA
VRVIGNGRGFSISAEAIALASAQEGQAVRVRTDSGRVLSGTARAGRQVEVVF